MKLSWVSKVGLNIGATSLWLLLNLSMVLKQSGCCQMRVDIPECNGCWYRSDRDNDRIEIIMLMTSSYSPFGCWVQYLAQRHDDKWTEACGGRTTTLLSVAIVNNTIDNACQSADL